MDTKLVQGDHWRSPQGHPVPIMGVEALVQQALLRLSIAKGSFLYDKSLGSQLRQLWLLEGRAAGRAAHSFATEALAPMKEVTVVSARCFFPLPDVLQVTVELALAEKNIQLEVMF